MFGSVVLPSLPQGQLGLDDLEREEVVSLQPEDVAEAFDLERPELPISGGRSSRGYQPLGFEEANLRNRHIGKVVAQEVDDVADGQ